MCKARKWNGPEGFPPRPVQTRMDRSQSRLSTARRQPTCVAYTRRARAVNPLPPGKRPHAFPFALGWRFPMRRPGTSGSSHKDVRPSSRVRDHGCGCGAGSPRAAGGTASGTPTHSPPARGRRARGGSLRRLGRARRCAVRSSRPCCTAARGAGDQATSCS